MVNYLVHHGIQGQKWGVRRFQNTDGTLTAAGKARYGEGNTSNFSSNNSSRPTARQRNITGSGFGVHRRNTSNFQQSNTSSFSSGGGGEFVENPEIEDEELEDEELLTSHGLSKYLDLRVNSLIINKKMKQLIDTWRYLGSGSPAYPFPIFAQKLLKPKK